MRKLFVIVLAGCVTVTAVVAVLSARKGDQRRSPPPATQTNKTLNLDSSPARFPRR
ncbi:MAG TPA: hypothetical protein VLZ12_05330 [Verrucomicrobiae bacterium]|nr:hypothetical protein [Verrucomicrobiae bacterium]